MFVSSYSLDITLQWVTWKTHKVLFLPYDRRPVRFAVKNNILAIVHRSGRLTFLELKPDINLLEMTDNSIPIVYTKAGGIEIRPLSEHQTYNLENVHITTATLIKSTQKIIY
jgi:hypothetical protein